jgi:glycosyltransferase involved in cell wall biosynthesis
MGFDSADLNIAAEAPARVLLLLGSLDGGGAERVAVNLIRHCDPALVDLRLGVLRRTGAYLGDIEPCRLVGGRAPSPAWKQALTAPADIARMVAEVKPDLLMSFGLGVNMLTGLALGLLGPGRPRWICREDSNLEAEIGNVTPNPLGRAAVKLATRLVHQRADCLLAVGEDLGAELGRRRPRADIQVIHNPTETALIARFASQPLGLAPPGPFIVAAGRLVRQKGFDLLIKAFADSERAREHRLVILGEGVLEAELKRQAAELGVADRVSFPGFQANPWAWFARADLFVLPSRWEGFGNVVAEAMACGTATLVTDCDFGPREQVTHGLDGWVAAREDTGALTRALDALLADPALIRRLAKAGQARSRAFDVQPIARAYADFFLEQAELRRAASSRLVRPVSVTADEAPAFATIAST